MPNATITQETHHFDLKTLPGAFIELRQLPYADMLVRRDKATQYSMEQEVGGSRRQRANNQPRTARMIMETMQAWEREYMFKNCIVEHNLTDANETPLDFNNPMTFKMLRFDVALEIEKHIDELHAGEDDEFQEDFPIAASPSSSHQTPEPETLPPSDSQTN